MNIIIPMAGLGKRMRPHTLTTPKPLTPIAGKPMVQRIVEDIISGANEAVTEIVFIINPAFGKEVERLLLQVAASLGSKGKIAYQEQPLGTAHAILAAGDSLQGPVFVAFADTLFKAHFKIDPAKDAIIWTQKVEDPSAFGVVKLRADESIEAFVEKPAQFVSDLAIIGMYYFKDGLRLRREMQRLIDEDIRDKGEYQLTDAMDHMLRDGVKFYTDQVEEWLDCGNFSATVYTTGRIMAIKQAAGENMHSASAILEDSVIIPPCFIGEHVRVRHSVIGPNVALEAGCQVENARVSDSIIGENTVIKNTVLSASLLGKHVSYSEAPRVLSLGDFSSQS
ncbi:MAG: NTP transferase domain-containing protein [Bacteroidetes bacterium]|nr:NTP transferase domain-containing protein [Bacteroidota bacterium]MBS1628885.1 NTP transferase domain-containing protein [Bacteroidota bacterium]